MNSALLADTKLIGWMTTIRRHLHQYPELGFEEHETSRYIREKLDELGITYRPGIAKTGIIAAFGDKSPGTPTIALRADMDALPIEEKTGLSFSSKNAGIMHACGHDGHVAMLLGAAALLKKQKPAGRLIFLFQPAEEGEGGAKSMIANGALDDVDAIFCGHIDRHFQIHKIAVEPGLICAYTDEFRIEIQGHGGHAAKPHETVDSIVVASLLVMNIQTLVSREVDPVYPSVITVGKLNGGTAPNVIADRAILEGTIRTTHPDIRGQIIKGMQRIVDAMEDLYHARTTITFTEGYPPVVNDPTAARIAREVARQLVGKANVPGLPHPSMGGEDFSFYLEKVPGCLVRFGARKKGHENVPAHSPRFDFDEGVLPIGAQFLAQVASAALVRIDELRKTGHPSPKAGNAG